MSYVDLHSALSPLPPASSLSDGLHLAGPGHAVLARLLAPLLDSRLGRVVMLPEWRELDNPEAAASYQAWVLAHPDRI